MNKVKSLIIGISLMMISIPYSFAEAKFSELSKIRNKTLLSSTALSISDFEGKSNEGFVKVSIYDQLYSDSYGMLNYNSGVGVIEETKGLIIVLQTKSHSYVYYNGDFAYSVSSNEEFSEDLKSENIGTQLYAISNYHGVEI